MRFSHPEGAVSRFSHPEGVASRFSHPEGVASRFSHPEGVASRFSHPEGVERPKDLALAKDQILQSLRSFRMTESVSFSGSKHFVFSRPEGVVSRFSHPEGVASRFSHPEGVASRFSHPEGVERPKDLALAKDQILQSLRSFRMTESVSFSGSKHFVLSRPEGVVSRFSRPEGVVSRFSHPEGVVSRFSHPEGAKDLAQAKVQILQSLHSFRMTERFAELSTLQSKPNRSAF